jgi:hypothetical protein
MLAALICKHIIIRMSTIGKIKKLKASYKKHYKYILLGRKD